jgi:hypothetical protein
VDEERYNKARLDALLVELETADRKTATNATSATTGSSPNWGSRTCSTCS